jgi:hypothetical protein
MVISHPQHIIKICKQPVDLWYYSDKGFIIKLLTCYQLWLYLEECYEAKHSQSFMDLTVLLYKRPFTNV